LVLDSFALTGRVAFVTGAGSGIGQRLAAALAEAGADVACFDRNHAAACRTAAEIKAIGRHAAVFSGDVTDAGTVSEAVTRAVDALGPISVDCNCAGIAGATAAEEMEPADFRRVVDVNLTGVFLSCQAEARVMLAYGGGSIINVASMSGTIVTGDYSKPTTIPRRPPLSTCRRAWRWNGPAAASGSTRLVLGTR
jgi:NAD(P)-dependent dehydrogenase (short-subunit alcohol dehydrogenase family)